MSSAISSATPEPAARIRQAARRHFERFGYRRAGVAEIARDAGVAAGTIYRHFESKEDLLRQVLLDASGEWLELARQALSGPGSALERLARMGAASIEHYRRDRLLSAVMNRDAEIIFAPLLEQEHAKVLEANVAMMAETIREGIADGEIRGDLDPELTAFVLFVAGERLFDQNIHPYEVVQPLFGRIALEGLRPR